MTIFPSMRNFTIFSPIGNLTREVEPSCMEKTSQEGPSSLYGFHRWTFKEKFFPRQLPKSLGKWGQVAKRNHPESHLLWVFFLEWTSKEEFIWENHLSKKMDVENMIWTWNLLLDTVVLNYCTIVFYWKFVEVVIVIAFIIIWVQLKN